MNLRLAIIGAGLISKGSHLPASLGSARADVTAIIDPVLDRANSLTKEFGIDVPSFSQLDEAFDLFDAAVVATPNSTHAAIAISCIEAGKSVLIEKPLATTVVEGEAIVSAATAKGVTLATGYSTRFRNNVALLKDLIGSKRFGETRRFVNRFGSPGGWSPLSSYNLSKDVAGGGVLMVTGTHFLDRMLYLWGMPDDVSMLSDAQGGAEANCHCHFDYESGMRGGAIFSKTVALPAGTVIEMEDGHVVLGEFDDSQIIFRPHHAPHVEQIVQSRGDSFYPSGADSFELQIDDFVSACLDGRAPLVSGEDGLQSLRLIERLYSSADKLSEDWFTQVKIV